MLRSLLSSWHKTNRKGGGKEEEKENTKCFFWKNMKVFFFFFLNQKDDDPSIYNDIMWGQFIYFLLQWMDNYLKAFP